MKNVFLRLCLCIGGWFGLLCSAHAGLIIDTGEPPEPGYGSAFMGSNNGNYQYVAGKIKFASAYQINRIDTHLKFYEPYFASGGAFSIVLYNDDNTSGPGNLVYSAGGGYMPADSQGAWYGISGLDWLVEAGSYWIAFEAQDSSINAIMSYAARPAATEHAYNINFWGYNGYTTDLGGTPFSLRIDANSMSEVPEPGSLMLLLSALLTVFSAYGFRRNASAC
jgi:hypothetical protein